MEILSYNSNRFNLNADNSNKDLVLANRRKFFEGVGEEIPEGDITLKDVLRIGSLDYIVAKTPLAYTDDFCDMVGLERGTLSTDDYRTYANINGKFTELGRVGKQYVPVQNFEAFDFLEDMMAGRDLQIECAGSTDGGRRAFICASTEPMTVCGDEIAPYIVFMNSHDGSSGVRVCFTPVRVFCSNCENLAIKKAERRLSIKHSTNVHSNLYIAGQMLLQNTKYLEAYKEEMENLAQYRFSRLQFMTEIIPMILRAKKLLDENNNELARKRNKDIVEIHQNYLLGCWEALDLSNDAGSAYNCLQAITDYESHMRPAKNADNMEQYFNRGIADMALATMVLNYLKEQPLTKIYR